jgi:hypothetical protein
VPFVVTVEGEEFNTDDLTLDETVAIEQGTGESWLSINPFQSAKQAREIIVVFLARRHGQDVARKIAGGMTLKQTLDGVKHVDSDLPEMWTDGMPDPKAEGQ